MQAEVIYPVQLEMVLSNAAFNSFVSLVGERIKSAFIGKQGQVLGRHTLLAFLKPYL